MTDIISAVIVNTGVGFIAYIRFSNSLYDANISNKNKYLLYRLFEAQCIKAGVQ